MEGGVSNIVNELELPVECYTPDVTLVGRDPCPCGNNRTTYLRTSFPDRLTVREEYQCICGRYINVDRWVWEVDLTP